MSSLEDDVNAAKNALAEATARLDEAWEKRQSDPDGFTAALAEHNEFGMRLNGLWDRLRRGER